MGNPLVESWIYATMQIENERGETGTGFLVSRRVDEKGQKLFLVSNKHVIGKDREERIAGKSIRIRLNVKENESVIGKEIKMPLEVKGDKTWREHQDEDIDVLALNVTPILITFPQIEKKWVEYSMFATIDLLQRMDVTMGEDVMVIGYPTGIRHRTTNFPLLRSGIIATRIGEQLEDNVKDPKEGWRKRILRGFLVDGGTIPGSSGSPVVLKPVIGRKVKNDIILGLSVPILLGIIAESRYAPIRTEGGDFLSFAGLGLAFDAETIKETIELFFQ